MRGKLQCGAAFRRSLPAVILALGVLGAMAAAAVSGRMTIMDKGDKPAQDVAQAVIWLSGPDAPVPSPVQAEITTSEKELSPHVLVVPVGSTVNFPNHD